MRQRNLAEEEQEEGNNNEGEDEIEDPDVNEDPNKTSDGTQQPREEKEYWRPSFMFHWQKAIGKNMEEAYEAFQDYKGREGLDVREARISSSKRTRGFEIRIRSPSLFVSLHLVRLDCMIV